MFKLVMVILLLAVTYGAAVDNIGDNFVIGTLLETNYVSYLAVEASANPEFVCPTGKLGNVCADDCKTLLACATTNLTPIFSNKCSDLTPSAPYCIPGKSGCSTTGDANNINCASTSNFVCTNLGYFPDPMDCSRYHFCTENFVQTYVCPPSYVYDAINLRCKAKRSTNDCVTIKCPAQSYQYAEYAANKAFYAYCGVTSGGTKEIIMFRCYDGIDYTFNPFTHSCEYVCKSEGWYPAYSNCKDFYECYKSGQKLLSRLQTCPISYVFDATKKLCVKGECADESQPITVTMAPTTLGTTTFITTHASPL